MVLYVACDTPRMMVAIDNLRMISENHLEGCYHIEVVDLLKLPEPIKRIIGGLSATEKVFVRQNIHER